ncbi:4-hydroxy-tetrahydrodipicolinate reductase [Chlamydia sp. 17-3921]|uniref:4-hydroxy-tetrahydrodipicolinate reductase n=1 Tax=Chlamydia sp. 17-3921 TaxID=2675798 RepID=UPI001919CF87|nr:dihydrodipicolinate reductase C-terminal domain-containing protein [Chlamydia sp. 17-3921]
MRVGLIGCLGKMGRCIASLLEKDSHYDLGPGFSRHNEYSLQDVIENNDILVDFSSSELTDLLMDALLCSPKPVILGTSGFPGDCRNKQKKLKHLAQYVPVVVCPNTSLGAVIQKLLASLLSQWLDDRYDIRISETHHKHKRDTVSGTAQDLISVVSKAKQEFWGLDYALKGAEKKIELHVSRVGDIPGEHEISFISDEEHIILRHTVFSREVFARGVLHILEWLKTELPKPGLYGLEDIFKLSSKVVNIPCLKK